MSDKPAREWLIETQNIDGNRVFELKDNQFILEYRGRTPVMPIRVIEHDAYDQLLKQLTNVTEERDEFKDQVDQFAAGVLNFKCQECGHYTSPHFPVNMVDEIKRAYKERDELHALLVGINSHVDPGTTDSVDGYEIELVKVREQLALEQARGQRLVESREEMRKACSMVVKLWEQDPPADWYDEPDVKLCRAALAADDARMKSLE